MNQNGRKLAFQFYNPAKGYEQTSTAAAAQYGDTTSQAAIESLDYVISRQQRLAERLRNVSDRAAARWNHLITVVVRSQEADEIAALPRTLGSLLTQRYRNIEVLVVGKPNVQPRDTGDFASYRGLFLEPAVDVLDLLSDPGTDALWRGSHLVFACAGSEFDPDAVELLNGALDIVSDAAIPTIVFCEHDWKSCHPEGPAPSLLPGLDADLAQAVGHIETAFMVSRSLLLQARGQIQQTTLLADWLRGLATVSPSPHIVHVAETLIHIPHTSLSALQPSSRSSPSVAP